MKFALYCLLFGSLAYGQVSVTASHYGLDRRGWNNSESTYTSTTVLNAALLKKCTISVDGAVYAQTLIVPNILASGAYHNLLIVATMHDSVYAFDADSCASVWHAGPLATSRTSYPTNGSHQFYDAEIGCMSTPVVDVANSTVYAVCSTSAPAIKMFQLSLADGSTSGSVTLTATVTGTGDPGGTQFQIPGGGADNVSSGNLTFYPNFQMCRPGLTLLSGHVYAACGASDDARPYHGWVFGVSTSTMAIDYSWCASPNGWGGGIWQSGAGLSSDGTYLFALTGNGTNPDGDTNWSESVIKFNANLTIADWYTPSNYNTLNGNDSDLASTRLMLTSDGHGVFGAKDYQVYNVNLSCMGHVGGTVGGCTAPQIFGTNTGACCTTHSGIYGGLCFDDACYFPNTNGLVYGFTYSSGTFNTTAFTGSTRAYPGAMMAGTSNGSSTKLVWAVTVATDAENSAQTGTLRVLSATDLSQVVSLGTIGNIAKFQVPTIANGKVYVGASDSTVSVYSLNYSKPRLSGGRITGGTIR